MRLQRSRFLLISTLVLVSMAWWPAAAAAQRRAPVGRAPGGRAPVVHVPVRPRLIVHGGFYGPTFFDPYFGFGSRWYGWGGSWYGWGSPWYGYPYEYQYGYPASGYYGRPDVLSSSVRLEVTPRNTEVFVDGFRAGTVDDFDGFFQRLRVRPGEHELVLYLDGYRAVHQRVYLNTGSDQRIRYTMVPLGAGEQAEQRPQPPLVTPDEPRDQPGQMMRPRGGGFGPGPGQGPGQGRGGPPPMRPQPGGPGTPDASFGAVSIRVQPADAEVLIDGEPWSGPSGQDRLVVQLPDGRHRVEVRKNGFQTYSSDVEVRRGETITLNVSLLRRSN